MIDTVFRQEVQVVIRIGGGIQKLLIFNSLPTARAYAKGVTDLIQLIKPEDVEVEVLDVPLVTSERQAVERDRQLVLNAIARLSNPIVRQTLKSVWSEIDRGVFASEGEKE